MVSTKIKKKTTTHIRKFFFLTYNPICNQHFTYFITSNFTDLRLKQGQLFTLFKYSIKMIE